MDNMDQNQSSEVANSPSANDEDWYTAALEDCELPLPPRRQSSLSEDIEVEEDFN